jgi:hypothetical protein
LRPHAKRAGSNPEKQRGSFITPETWMAARLTAARHDAREIAREMARKMK